MKIIKIILKCIVSVSFIIVSYWTFLGTILFINLMIEYGLKGFIGLGIFVIIVFLCSLGLNYHVIKSIIEDIKSVK